MIMTFSVHRDLSPYFPLQIRAEITYFFSTNTLKCFYSLTLYPSKGVLSIRTIQALAAMNTTINFIRTLSFIFPSQLVIPSYNMMWLSYIQTTISTLTRMATGKTRTVLKHTAILTLQIMFHTIMLIVLLPSILSLHTAIYTPCRCHPIILTIFIDNF